MLAGVRVELYRVERRRIPRDHDHQRQRCLLTTTRRQCRPCDDVRVVNGTVRSARTGGAACTTCVPVQTFRTDRQHRPRGPVTDRVGGENPASSDAVVGPTVSLASATHGGRPRAAVHHHCDPGGHGIDHHRHRFRIQLRYRREYAGRHRLRRDQFELSLPGIAATVRHQCHCVGWRRRADQSGSGQIDGAISFLPSGFESSIFMIPTAPRIPGSSSVCQPAHGLAWR